MRTNFTSYDIKSIVDSVFNGNKWQAAASNGKISYENPNSETILLTDEDTGAQKAVDIADYLNIRFYVWKNRLVEKEGGVQPYQAWVDSLNFSMNESYALVELIDNEVTASQDIDSASVTARITFIVQADKVVNLDFYTTKLQNAFLGVPQDIQNSYGERLKAYILLGSLMYDEEPTMTPYGEMIVCSNNIKISYLNDAQTYGDTSVEISFDGDDLYDGEGNIVDAQGQPTATKYLQMPITRHTWQNIFSDNSLPIAQRPDMVGFVATAASNVKTLTFYDFNKPLTEKFNKVFWETCAYRINGQLKAVREPNIPVYVRVRNGGDFYVYKDMISNMQKDFTNNDFVVSSVTLKGWGKVEQTV